ncbi:hypothetical protein [Amnibacterium endophyticum]|uniref:Secreted protein n=1 Tax=Amnibacterium endophyticum TaxID=2109337 RepID=A0ABW4LAY6_9MICO
MGALIEAGVFLLVAAAVVVLVVLVLRDRAAPGEAVEPQRTVSDRHRHRWTRWQVIDERRIHLYGEVDEGRDLPDRVDVVLRRECARCGLPQTQTVRGLDAQQRG